MFFLYQYHQPVKRAHFCVHKMQLFPIIYHEELVRKKKRKRSIPKSMSSVSKFGVCVYVQVVLMHHLQTNSAYRKSIAYQVEIGFRKLEVIFHSIFPNTPHFANNLGHSFADVLFGDHTAEAINSFLENLLSSLRCFTLNSNAVHEMDPLHPFHQISSGKKSGSRNNHLS